MRLLFYSRGYKEKGITTSFDMCVLNDLDRFPWSAMSLIVCPVWRPEPHMIEHKHYIREHGEDLPEVRNWNRKG